MTSVSGRFFIILERRVEEFIKYIENMKAVIPIRRKRKKMMKIMIQTLKSSEKNVFGNQHTRTGFLGLIICLTNYVNLFKDLYCKTIFVTTC